MFLITFAIDYSQFSTTMKDVEKKKSKYSLDLIPEPESIEDIIYSLMVDPNLSNINYFNDFSESLPSPDIVGDEDKDEISVFDLDSTGTRMIMSTHAFHHRLKEDPQKSTEILISKATRRIVCLGAEPLAISAFLYHINIGNPNGQNLTYGAKKGLENAAGKFSLKILDRKVRFDNFSDHEILPSTLIISIIGKIDKETKIITHSFKKKGNNIFVIGDLSDDLGSSEYLDFYHGISNSPLPEFDIEIEKKLQNALKELNKASLIAGASPVGKGGLFFTLLRAAIPNELGFDITTAAETRIDSFLFGEAMGRILVDVEPEKEDLFVDMLSELNVPFFTLGHVTKGEIRIDDKSLGFIDKMNSGI